MVYLSPLSTKPMIPSQRVVGFALLYSLLEILAVQSGTGLFRRVSSGLIDDGHEGRYLSEGIPTPRSAACVVAGGLPCARRPTSGCRGPLAGRAGLRFARLTRLLNRDVS